MKTRLHLTALLLFCGISAHAQTLNTCQNAANYSSATLTASTQLLVAPSNLAFQSIHICSYAIQVSQSATPVTFGFTSGTGSVCATGSGLVTPLYLGVASVAQFISENFDAGNSLTVGAGKNLCLTMSGAPTGAVVHITWSAY